MKARVDRMQLFVRHRLEEELVLPLNYHHILQAIIYSALSSEKGMDCLLHDAGAGFGDRCYKLFTFSLLRGRYEIADRKIVFRDEVSFEVRSPDILLIQCLAENFAARGIRYGDRRIGGVEVRLADETVEQDMLQIRMITPLCVYTTDRETHRTHFYEPSETGFAQMVHDNFLRKYAACYGVMPDSGVVIRPVRYTQRDKFVTKYQGFYVSGWYGTYLLCGERKYLDFLYQAGLGARNSQGFGMFRILEAAD